MSHFLTVLFFSLLVTPATYTINFGEQTEQPNWRIINDGVMGGMSKGKVEFRKNSVLFSGTISLENNGGFSSYKGPFQSTDLSAYTHVKIRYRSIGEAVNVTLETDRRFFRPYFKLRMEPTDDWKTVSIPLTDFTEYQLGQPTGNKLTQEALASIQRIGFLVGEKKPGSFEVEVDFVEFQ